MPLALIEPDLEEDLDLHPCLSDMGRIRVLSGAWILFLLTCVRGPQE